MIKYRVKRIKKPHHRPKVLVSVIGGGLGHVTRTYAILLALKEYAQVRVMTNSIGYDFFKKTEFETVEIDSIELWGKDNFTFSISDYFTENIRLPFALGKNYRIISKEINDFNPDVILTDSEPYSFLVARIKKIPIILITNYITTTLEYKNLSNNLKTKDLDSQIYLINNITDGMIKNSNLVLNPSIEPVKNLSRRIAFPGMITRKKEKDLPEIRTLRKRYNLPENFYLVSFGGSNYGMALMKRLLPVLRDYPGKNFVVSTNYLVNKPKQVGNTLLLPFVDNYLEFLKCSEGVISLAGLSTIFETLSFKKPSLIFPINNHIEQICNANIIDRNKYGIVSYLDKHIDPQAIRKKLNKLFSNREEIINNLKKSRLNDNGKIECVKLILDAVKVQ